VDPVLTSLVYKLLCNKALVTMNFLLGGGGEDCHRLIKIIQGVTRL